MRYVIQNIRTLIKNEKFIFAVMLICVFVSAWVMTFSYGMYHNYSEMLNKASDRGCDVHPKIADGKSLTRGDLVRYLAEVSPKTLNAMKSVFVQSGFDYTDRYGNEEYKPIFSRFVIRDNSVIPSPYVVQIWNDENILVSGRYISDAEETNGEKVALINEKSNVEYSPELLKDDKTVMIDGEEYTIIGTHNSSGFIVPLLSIPENMELTNNMILSFERPVTRKQHDELVRVAERVLPGTFVFPEQEFVDEESIYIYNNMIVVSILIAALTIINFAFLYSFILQKRAKTLAIMRICGCTRGGAWRICMGECCLICIPVFLVGMLTYIPFMHGVLSGLFEFIEQAYSFAVYAFQFAIYVVMLFVIMGIMLSRHIRLELAEGRKGGAV